MQCVLFIGILFLSPILLIGAVVRAYIMCSDVDESQAHWAFPVAGYLFVSAAVVQGQGLALTFMEDFEDGKKYISQNCVRVSILVSGVEYRLDCCVACHLVILLKLAFGVAEEGRVDRSPGPQEPEPHAIARLQKGRTLTGP